MAVNYCAVGCGALLAVVFGVAAGGKARGPALRAFARSLAAGRLVPAAWALPVAVAVTAAEAGTVVLITVPATSRYGMLAATGLSLVLAAGVGLALRRGTAVPCLCFGGGQARPLGRGHLARNLALAVAGTAGLFATPGPAGLFAAPDPAGLLAAAAGVVLALLTVRGEALVDLFRPLPTDFDRSFDR
jgi:Methylamine utilisation protein MauE